MRKFIGGDYAGSVVSVFESTNVVIASMLAKFSGTKSSSSAVTPSSLCK